MLYKLILDDNNYLVSFIHTGTEEDTIELNQSEMDLNNLDCYHLVDDEIILDEEKLKNKIDEKAKTEKIARLKQELASTDYLALKYAEGWFTDEQYELIKATRENLRQQIRELLGETDFPTETIAKEDE